MDTDAVARACNGHTGPRQAFGDRLDRKPLHLATLATMELETRAATHLVFEVAELLGRAECQVATPTDQLLLRLLTPVMKVRRRRGAGWAHANLCAG